MFLLLIEIETYFIIATNVILVPTRYRYVTTFPPIGQSLAVKITYYCKFGDSDGSPPLCGRCSSPSG